MRNLQVCAICIICLIILGGSLLITSPSSGSPAFQEQPTLGDYVMLLDISGSMLAPPSPTFLDQLKKNSVEFINQLPDGSHVIIYTFDTQRYLIGDWSNLNDIKKADIAEKINAIQSNNKDTALWDTICQGIDDLEQLTRQGDDHYGMLLSFTDGKNTYPNTTYTRPDCQKKYDDLCQTKLYWAYYAFGNAEIPGAISNDQCIDIETGGTLVPPLQLVNTFPTTLDYKNLYETGTGKACLVSWLTNNIPDSSKITFKQSPVFERPLPEGVTVQLCNDNSPNSCVHEMSITTNQVCIDLNLVNYQKSGLDPAIDTGNYSISLPINIEAPQNEHIVLVPRNLTIKFSLDVSTPTFTYTPAPSNTLVPTSTPIPTSTSIPTSTTAPTPTSKPGSVIVGCQGVAKLDFGELLPSAKAGEDIILDKGCSLSWQLGEIPPYFTAKLDWDTDVAGYTQLSDYIGILKDGKSEKTVSFSQGDNVLTLHLDVPASFWEGRQAGKYPFQGQLVLEPTDTNMVGDITREIKPYSIPVSFVLAQPAPPPPLWLIPLIVVVLIVILIFITRPRFPNDYVIKEGGAESSGSDLQGRWWDGTIFLGGGDKASIRLGNEDQQVLQITPSWHGSLAGRLLSQRDNITYHFTPLNESKLSVPGIGDFEADQTYQKDDEADLILQTDKGSYSINTFRKIEENDISLNK